ncbi:MAG: FAD-dependent oxidoreductase, partial [bacterium]
MKVCIVGGVAGGVTAAARLRRLDEKAQIILFERGDHISFANCGLPYHISGKIKDRRCLFLQTPENFRARFQVEVRIRSEVLTVNPQSRTIRVNDRKSGREYEESYDFLILSPGAYPFVPPMEGNTAGMFKRLRDIPDMEDIIDHIKTHQVKEAVVIGGGFIGLEVAENLVELGIKTHLVEMTNQVMAPFDFEMANIIQATLAEKGIHLHLSDRVKRIDGDLKGKVMLHSGTELQADLVIGAIGVRPENTLAKEAGLRIGVTGGIVVDEHMRTSDPHIFAVGDAVEVTHLLEGKPVLIPLAGPANKQGRVAADNICGLNSSYHKALGTSILKVFELQAACCGLNEKTAQKNNFPYQAIHLHPLSHAGYYPGASQMTLKALFEVPGGRILGAQCIGRQGVDKRIDVMATAMAAGMTVHDLEQLELSYAPPFGSAKDPVNMVGFVGSNILKGLVEMVTYDQMKEIENPFFLDVRTRGEFSLGSIPQAVNIPVDELRQRIDELPRDRHIMVFCQVGIRAYAAYRILRQSGFDRLSNFSGGYKTYNHYVMNVPDAPGYAANTCISLKSCSALDSSLEKADPGRGNGGRASGDEELDLTGLQCPGPIMRLSERLEAMKAGERVLARASDHGFLNDLPAFGQVTGHKIVYTRSEGNTYLALIEKAKDHETAQENNHQGNGNKKTIVVFSSDLDRALAAFVIANGARSMGSEVTLFFTFWGLNILRREQPAKVRKSLLDRMFGLMMPKGAGRLKLSKLHMAGLGTEMMKYVMKEKKVDSLPYLMQRALESGVRFVACSMSMEVMGITREE